MDCNATLSDLEMSFESEDSGIYFIPGYQVEAEEADSAWRSDALLSSSKDKPAASYVDDPIADEEWSAKCQKEVESDEKLKRELKRRLQGNTHLLVLTNIYLGRGWGSDQVSIVKFYNFLFFR